jgi:hypothetical protein
MQIFFRKYSGIFVAGIYILGTRIAFNSIALKQSFLATNLFSLSFVLILPLTAGLITVLLTLKHSRTILYSILAPLVAILFFFITAIATKMENIVSLLIITPPFIIAGVAGGLIAKFISLHKNKQLIYFFLLLPFASSWIENRFVSPENYYLVKTSVVMNTTPDKIWPHVIRVEDIREAEFCKGLFNYTGVPRPLYAELDKDTVGATRRGHFDGGLIFEELVSVWQRNKKIQMYIKTDDKEIGMSVFNEHVLKGNVFSFINASYELQQIEQKKTLVILSSVYRLKSKMNIYASFWGHSLLSDFQNRLLSVIKQRCDNL